MREALQSKTAWAVTVHYLDGSYWRELACRVRASNAGLAADRALKMLKADGRIPPRTRLHKVRFAVTQLAPVGKASRRREPAAAATAARGAGSNLVNVCQSLLLAPFERQG